jgi:DNA (cytosine-5)-methyltransferase 1
MPEGPHDTASMRAASGGSSRSYVAQEADTLVWAVRRLTPRECERLQGFPDDYTDVPYRRRNWTPDGPRYKALGNSMAVNVMGWLGERIGTVDVILQGLRTFRPSKTTLPVTRNAGSPVHDGRD